MSSWLHSKGSSTLSGARLAREHRSSTGELGVSNSKLMFFLLLVAVPSRRSWLGVGWTKQSQGPARGLIYDVRVAGLPGWSAVWRWTERVCRGQDILYVILFLDVFGEGFLSPMRFLFPVVQSVCLLNIFDEFTIMRDDIFWMQRFLTISPQAYTEWRTVEHAMGCSIQCTMKRWRLNFGFATVLWLLEPIPPSWSCSFPVWKLWENVLSRYFLGVQWDSYLHVEVSGTKKKKKEITPDTRKYI